MLLFYAQIKICWYFTYMYIYRQRNKVSVAIVIIKIDQLFMKLC